jgi:DNA-binding NarL/FixJ family response regulator
MIFLIADDNQRFRKSVSRYILSRIPDHHTIVEASDGREAAALYDKVRPDWVLMDIAMEPMDGLTGAVTILGRYPDARIVILTNYNDPDYRAAAERAGVSAFILKERLVDLMAILSPQSTRGSL